MRDPRHVASRSFLVGRPASPYLRPTVLGERGKERESRDRRGRVDHFVGPRRPRLPGHGPGRLALLFGAALLCRPPLRVSDVHRQPTRPVLKHGPRSPGRSRVVGANYEPRRRSESERACWRAPDLERCLGEVGAGFASWLPSRARSCRRDEYSYFPSSAPRSLSSP